MKPIGVERNLELYIHIPFCVKKCAYCDFLSAPAGEETRAAYVRALVKEIRAAAMPEGAEEHESDRMDRVFLASEAGEKQAAARKNREAEATETGIKRGKDRQGTPQEDITCLPVTSIFFGGGTPSLLEASQIEAILSAVRERFRVNPEAEISLEANPGTLTREKLKACRSLGINRLSMGLQSPREEELRLLGRIHTYEEFLANYHAAREAGFSNINVDLISALPDQTLAQWEENLERVAKLGPEHLSAYSLIVEEGTPFFARYAEDERRRQKGLPPLHLPSEELERDMYRATRDILADYGYRQYEISNYAKAGFECRHNNGYWTGVPYLGFGLGAASYTGAVRFSRTRDLKKYLRHLGESAENREEGQSGLAYPERIEKNQRSLACPETMENKHSGQECPESTEGTSSDNVLEKEWYDTVEFLTKRDKEEEFFFLGLRRMEGVSEDDFRNRFGNGWEEYENAMERLIRMGLLDRSGDILRLTEDGMDVSNMVFAELLA